MVRRFLWSTAPYRLIHPHGRSFFPPVLVGKGSLGVRTEGTIINSFCTPYDILRDATGPSRDPQLPGET
jgi:hypothetical protein